MLICRYLVFNLSGICDYLLFFYCLVLIFFFIEHCNTNCQVLAKNLNVVAGMTRRFVSAKRLIRYFSNFSKLVEHGAQSSPVREAKMLAVWPSIAEGQFDNFLLHISRERVVGNPSAIEDQTANILTLRTGL